MFSLIWNTVIIEPMVNILLLIYRLIPNFGIAIILFTILIRLITHPLSVSQIKSGQKMQEIQRSKEWQDIQKKYKDDKQKLQQEQMRLYQENKINPLGSCLPTLIQFPIIIGLYQAIIRVLGGSPVQLIDLFPVVYKFPPFSTLIPISQMIPINNQFLWMDLSQPERLYILGIGIPVLAIIVVATTWLQSRLMTPPSQPGDSSGQMTQAMNLYMPLLMGYLALTFAAGLSVYFVASNVFTIGQYAVMGKVDWKNVLPRNLLLGRRAAPAQTSMNVKDKSAKPLPKPAPSENKNKPTKSKSAKTKTAK